MSAELTLLETIQKILKDDAKVTSSGHLGHTSLLGKSSISPYGIYYINPPEPPDIPQVVFQLGSTSSSTALPTNITLMLSAYGNNYEEILNCVYSLLQGTVISGISDYKVLVIFREWESPVMFDDELKIYYRHVRYMVKGVPI